MKTAISFQLSAISYQLLAFSFNWTMWVQFYEWMYEASQISRASGTVHFSRNFF